MGSPRAPLGDRKCFSVSWGDGKNHDFLRPYGVEPSLPVVDGDDPNVPCTDKDFPTLHFSNLLFLPSLWADAKFARVSCVTGNISRLLSKGRLGHTLPRSGREFSGVTGNNEKCFRSCGANEEVIVVPKTDVKTSTGSTSENKYP